MTGKYSFLNTYSFRTVKAAEMEALFKMVISLHDWEIKGAAALDGQAPTPVCS